MSSDASAGRRRVRGACDRVGVVGLLLGLALSAAFLGLLGRVAQLQIKPMGPLEGAGLERTRLKVMGGPRGALLDRRGRVLATTSYGYRAFVDPVRFPDPPDLAIGPLAEALGVSPERVGERVISRMEANRSLRAAAAVTGEKPQGLSRYVVVSGMLSEDRVAAVRSLGLPGVHLEQRAVRADVTGGLASPLIGKVGFDGRGLVGAEHRLDEQLAGADGRMRFVHDARGRAIWIHGGHFAPPEPGPSVWLSIDLELQRIAQEELARGVEEADAAGGRLVMIDTLTGEVLAMVDIVRDVDAHDFPWRHTNEEASALAGPGPSAEVDWDLRYRAIPRDADRELEPALARNRCVEDVYEPGSTLKPFVWALVTEAGAARPGEVFDTHGGRWKTDYGRALEDVTRRAEMTWEEVLVYSSNIGMAQAAERLDYMQLRAGVLRLGFGEPIGVELPGEASGLVTSARDWSKYTQTSVSFGYEIAVTPVQIVRAFAVFARPGELAGTLPSLTLHAREPEEPPTAVLHRVFSEETAEASRALMARVAERMEMKLARRGEGESEWRYEIFGKSGTTRIALGEAPAGMRRPPGVGGYLEGQYVSSFVAGGPLEDPRVAVIVVIDDPGPELVAQKRYYGSDVGGPVARRVLERGLTYLGIEPLRLADAEQFDLEDEVGARGD